MKVIQVNVVYGSGSTGKIVQNIHENLTNDGNQSYVFYGRGINNKIDKVVKVASELIMKVQSARSKITGYAFSGALISTYLLKKHIKRINPDIVHLHVLNGYYVNIYKLLRFLNNERVKTVITLHAEFMYTGGCGNTLGCAKWVSGCGNCPQKGSGLPSSKFFDRSSRQWKFMFNSFNDFDNVIFVGVSDWISYRARVSPILIDKEIITIMNGLDLNVFRPVGVHEILEKYRLFNKKILLHVTPDFENKIKGGNYMVDLANRFLNEEIIVIIVGKNINIKNKPSNIIIVNSISDPNELVKFYSVANLTILTSLSETFSMITAESLSCGTPVVGFKSGAPELIALKKYSYFVEQGDLDNLEKTIRNWLLVKEGNIEDIRIESSLKYSKDKMYELYKNVYERLIQS